MNASLTFRVALALCLGLAGAAPAARAPADVRGPRAQLPAATAAAAAAEDALSFPTRVLPILTKAGCNAGACHGAAIGQGAFKLSLLGYDPAADHDAIVREFSGRRVDLSSPEQSLLLRKATRDIQHKGGRRIEVDSGDYRTLLAWIDSNAPFGPRDLRVTRIDAAPSDVLVASPGETVQLRVTATLSDGSARDATAHALYDANDDAVADVADGGAVEVKRRGSTTLMVRYGGQVAAVRVGAPYGDAELAPPSITPHGVVDGPVWAELRRMRVPPAPPSDDAEFLRRVHLDLVGRLPAAADVRPFLAAPSTPARRARVIGELLGRPEFADLWTLRLADLLLLDSKRLGDGPARAYRDWLRDRVARNVPFDEVVRELLTADGDASRVPPANFHRTAQDPRDMGEFVSGALLGVQIACARCHAHPLAAWTQDDFHGFAAFFARTRQDGSRVLVGAEGEVRHPKTGRVVSPKPLGGVTSEVGIPNGDRRVALAAWLTSPDNPYFARATVNRVWRHLVGRGIVEPADDQRVTNPPSNPALLDALAADFVAGGYDLRRLVRVIAESRTYQLSSRASDGNRDDDRLFSHARVRPLSPQVLADAIADATGMPDAYPGYPPGTRAVGLVDARTPSYALDVLGRCTREAACDSRSRGGGVSQALHLMNGSTINDKLRGGADRLLRDRKPDASVVDELYLRTVSRFPTEAEREYCGDLLGQAEGADDKRRVAEDLLWALLNSREFAYNH